MALIRAPFPTLCWFYHRYRLKRHRAVFVGSHAVDWLVHVKNFVNRTVACDALQLMLVGNLIREVGDRPVYKDSKKVR